MVQSVIRSLIRVLCHAILLFFAAGALASGMAHAHPHVRADVASVIVHDSDGRVGAVRHVWRFDDMFSAFATQGLDADGDGVLAREELADLAEVNVTSLSEFDFFTFAEAGGGPIAFDRPTDYWLDHDGTALTLHFTLPVIEPVSGPLVIEIYDPTYFVDFRLVEGGVTLEGAAPGCIAELQAANGAEASTDTLSESFFDQLEADSTFGQQFANTIVVRCPGDPVIVRERTPLEPAVPDALTDAPQGEPAGMFGSGKGLGAFGLIRPDGASSATTGVFGWVAAQQASFYAALSGALSAIRDGERGGWLLIALAFAYGVFHAAGPGHGKVVIASYIMATGETLRRGILISFASAMAQAVTAVALVLVIVLVFGVAGQALGFAAYWLEAASYGAIAVLGVMIVWRKGRALLARSHVHDDTCGPECGHGHMPEPQQLEGPFNWRRAIAVVLAVGLRPCTGAIVVLVFALANDILWAGVAATFAMALGTALTVALIAVFAVVARHAALRVASSGQGGGMVAVRLLEICGGFAIFLFGALLLVAMLGQRGVMP